MQLREKTHESYRDRVRIKNLNRYNIKLAAFNQHCLGMFAVIYINLPVHCLLGGSEKNENLKKKI